MSIFLDILIASLAIITLDNVIFTSAVGTSTLLECTKKPRQMVRFGIFITSFSLIASIISYFAEPLMLGNEIAVMFIPALYILSLGSVYIFTLLVVRFIFPKRFKYLSRFVHLTAFNCTSLSCLFINTINNGTLTERVIFALCVGLGFMLATYLMSINHKHLVSSEVPVAFRGFPVSVLYIGIISMIIYSANM